MSAKFSVGDLIRHTYFKFIEEVTEVGTNHYKINEHKTSSMIGEYSKNYIETNFVKLTPLEVELL